MSRIAYYRSSSVDQSVEAQRVALGGGFDREFMDEAVSGAVLAADRPGFAELLAYVRDGDLVCVYAVDRLGRDALDVQATVRKLLQKNVKVEVRGLGLIGPGAGELVLAVLAQVADMERHRIAERCASGRAAARASLVATGKTHRGKVSLGRPKACSVDEVVKWRKENSASVSDTARHFNISVPTVKRYCASVKQI
ncbi:recombinase family protein [Sphingobium yanoikuyae]|uniref:recombinase family protein n=1 Tax=Sphingobium yanoikuyae TaxID=13690 RepID=UPI003F097095